MKKIINGIINRFFKYNIKKSKYIRRNIIIKKILRDFTPLLMKEIKLEEIKDIYIILPHSNKFNKIQMKIRKSIIKCGMI